MRYTNPVSEAETKKAARWRKVKRAVRVAVVGAALALGCRALPVEYQSPCETIVKICSGGF
jgi:hypothetical protein